MPAPPPSDPAAVESVRRAMAAALPALQAEVCGALESLDGAATFSTDAWDRPGGGGGVARVLEGGAVLEKAGVNRSEVEGALPAALAALPGGGDRLVAMGLSVVIHPLSPLVPAAHMNVRLLARGSTAWFGGGADLTPAFLFAEDCAHFHRALRDHCEAHLPGSHPAMKRAADAYFFLPHRREHRGVGGIFFDDLAGDLERALAFALALPRAFLAAWLPLAERRRREPWGEPERAWQEVRRGRYVEFNLLHDRGTAFGLHTGGRVESILMSLPPRVRWPREPVGPPGPREAALLEVLRAPRDWT